MKKSKIIYFLLFVLNLFLHDLAFSQNLVPNPSFEIITNCPTANSQIYFAPPWFQPAYFIGGNTTSGSSTDLFNSCAPINSLTGISVPINALGYQLARTGIGYAGFWSSISTFNEREYIEVPLSYTLVTNRTYCVEFYVSLASVSQHAISNIGAYFSNDSLLTLSSSIDTIVPQIENLLGNIITDTANWVLVSGSFTATGGEKFMTIGNFHNPANTNSQANPGGIYDGAYYYLDDISVVDCTGDGVEEITDINTLTISPQPRQQRNKNNHQ